MDEFLHEGEDISVVSSGSQHQLAIAERIFHSFCHIVPGKVGNGDLLAFCCQLLSQQFYGLLGVAVNRGVSDHNAFTLHPVGRPDIVQIDVVAQIFGQHRAVQGSDDGNVQTGGLLQQCLYLGAILTNDADVVAAGFAGPVFFHIQRTKLAEAVGGEQDLVVGIIGYNNFGPVDHGCGDEGQHMLAQVQGVALADYDAAVSVIGAEELLHHGESLGGSHNGSLGVSVQEDIDICGVVRLHVLHNQVIGLTAFQRVFQILQPLLTEILIYGVHNGDLVVNNCVRIISHAVGYHILALEQVHLVIVHTDVFDIFGNGHSFISLYSVFC